MVSGIYKITNLKNKKSYIGSANNLKRRKMEHYKLLRHNKHPNQYLQNAWNKYSEWNFEFIVLANCEVEKLLINEQFYIDTFKPEYNLRQFATSNKGHKFSEEFRIKARNRQLNIKPSNETKAKMSEAQKKRKRPLNIGELISKGKKGKRLGIKHSEEQKSNMRIAQQKRRDKEFLNIFQNTKDVICI